MVISVKDLAFISNAVYDGVDYGDWKKKEFVKYTFECPVFDFSTFTFKKETKQFGFKAGIYKNGNEAVVTFAGSDDILDYWNDLLLGIGHTPPQVEAADMYYNKHLPSLTDADITITGHSLGGYLAEFIGNKYAKRTVTFNSPGSVGDIRDYAQVLNLPGSRIYEQTVTYGKEVVRRNPASEGLISHYLCRGDPISPIGRHMGKMHWMQPEVDYSKYNIDQFFGASDAQLIEMQQDGKFESETFGSTLSDELKKALFVTHSIKRWTSDESLYDGNGDLKPEKEVWVDED